MWKNLLKKRGFDFCKICSKLKYIKLVYICIFTQPRTKSDLGMVLQTLGTFNCGTPPKKFFSIITNKEDKWYTIVLLYIKIKLGCIIKLYLSYVQYVLLFCFFKPKSMKNVCFISLEKAYFALEIFKFENLRILNIMAPSSA